METEQGNWNILKLRDGRKTANLELPTNGK